MASETLNLKIKVIFDGATADANVRRTGAGFKLIDGIILGVGQSIVQFGKDAIRAGAQMVKAFAVDALGAASALEEQTNKFNVVFKGMSADAEEWSRVLVDSYAMSTRESRQFLGSMQDLLKPMGVMPELAGEMSFEMVKLAADLGSFNDLPTVEVMTSIQAAITGQFEGMRKFGIVINETTVKQEALNLGFEVGAGVLDPVVKAQAAYSLMLKGSTDAMGDLQRSSGSYANVLKKFLAVWEDVTAEVGKKFLPVATDVLKWAIEMAQSAMPAMVSAAGWLADTFRSLFEWIKDTAMPILFGFAKWWQDTTWLDKAIQAGNLFLSYLQTVTTAIWNTMKSLLSTIVDLYVKLWSKVLLWAFDNVPILFSNLVILIKKNLVFPILELFDDMWLDIRRDLQKRIDSWGQAWFLLPATIREPLEAIVNMVSLKADRVAGKYKETSDFITSDIFKTTTKAAETLGGFFDKLKEMGLITGDSLSNTAETTKAKITRTLSDLDAIVTLGARELYPQLGEEAGTAYAQGFADVALPVMLDTFASINAAAESAIQAMANVWTASDWTGTSSTQSGYDYNGQFYEFNAFQGEWGYTNWQGGLPSWVTAPQSFLDWLETQQQSAETGGFIDLLKGLMPSMKGGGLVQPTLLHAGEGVLNQPAMQRMGVDELNRRNRGEAGGGGVTVNIYAGTVLNPDGVHEISMMVGEKIKHLMEGGFLPSFAT